MLRAAFVSIALTLAIGQYGSLLCRTWCVPQAAAASDCHHEYPETSPTVAGGTECPGVVIGAAFLNEDLRRGGSASGIQSAVVVPRYSLVPVTSGDRSDHDGAHLRSHDNRPLDSALRL